ncbi:glycerol-3-phosphate 1-O-acyltransferase PlsB [Aestuariirhabdus sp. Z084]|uniref:glycerol-3-phosphate 1-O-acyltransferase PlsB n=1 Tax=Aestuariirhabdus haliotis TaxID=2918751 RepID=UPI00201B3CA2|nr:glycerol-3-phosphate 1-O-acyltransferase PlsB [Aestuariirhabdus haliotis]MCL6417392.1 glycerol-3-phosphate 1-O-acyltransferase PlsB [Aestuariirhabdus haliotis]MCL6421336.1 glycerol-3-phosphate 1-O-acyltransferase PlsB [Aestuariirhabdus haliotis]
MKKLFASRFSFNLLRRIQNLWVRPTIGGLENLDKLDRDRPVCYVLSHRSLSDLLVLEKQCLKANLPRPYQPMLPEVDESRAYFYLSQTKGLILQRDRMLSAHRLERLLHWVAEEPNRDVQLVPVSFFWGREPDKEESLIKLLFAYNYSVGGRFRKFITTLLMGRQTMIHFNDPMSLRTLVDEQLEHTRTMRKVNRILRVHFRQQRASVVGPDLSHRRTLVSGLVQTPAVQHAIAAEVEASGLQTAQIESRARHYANEIASDYGISAIRFLETVLSWFWNKIYKGIDVHNIEQVKEYAKRQHSLIYVPCHRSHIDYLLLSYLLYRNGLTPPHIAAGINLNMPVIGGLLRRAGAFFMRRSFRGNPLYSTVFNEYLHTLFTRGFPVEYFVEGGRSRTGRTLKPRTGMLAITLRSFLRDHRRPITFIPVYVGYERVLEGSTYLGELRGKSKKKESPLDIFRTLRGLNSSFGKVRVTFGEPLELEKFLDSQQVDWRNFSHDPIAEPPLWMSSVTTNLATRIASHINGAAAINPVNLVGTVLLSTRNQALGEEVLVTQLDSYLRLLDQVPYAPHITHPQMSAQELISYVEELGLIERRSDSLGDIIYLEGNNAVLMTYYRNNILHLFAIPSLLANYFINAHEVSEAELIEFGTILYPYLSSELFLHYDEQQIPEIIRRWLQAMTEQGLLICEGEAYKRPDSGSTEFVVLNLLGKAIAQTLERFYVVASLLSSNHHHPMTAEELENQCHDLAQRLSIINGLNAPEFFDKALFRNFISTMRQRNAVVHQEDGTLKSSQLLLDVTQNARRVLAADVRHSITQVTRGNQ